MLMFGMVIPPITPSARLRIICGQKPVAIPRMRPDVPRMADPCKTTSPANPPSSAGGSSRERSKEAALQDDHERRLEALARLGAAAAECGLRADTDRDLVLLAEDEVSLLESAGAPNGLRSATAIRPSATAAASVRSTPSASPPVAENPLEEANPHLRRIGGGVEAWAFAAADGSVYKFYLPREEKRIGSAFGFRPGRKPRSWPRPGSATTAACLEKLLLIHALGGMATEVIALTPEGILVAKQALGEPLPQGDDMSQRLPAALIEIPSRFCAPTATTRAFFSTGTRAWLVADLHARNFVRCADGALRVIDLVGAPWPATETAPRTAHYRLARPRAPRSAGLCPARRGGRRAVGREFRFPPPLLARTRHKKGGVRKPRPTNQFPDCVTDRHGPPAAHRPPAGPWTHCSQPRRSCRP
jgi:hypothetical protein